MPSEKVTRDIHCVTKWSKLDTTWEGVSIDTLLEGVVTACLLYTSIVRAAFERPAHEPHTSSSTRAL